MDSTAITTALTSIVTDVESVITGASPIVLGVIATITSVGIGISLFKKFGGKMK